MSDFTSIDLQLRCTYKGTNSGAYPEALSAEFTSNLICSLHASRTDARDQYNDWPFETEDANFTFDGAHFQLTLFVEDEQSACDLGVAIHNLVATMCRVAEETGTELTVAPLDASQYSYGDSFPNGSDEPHDHFVLADNRVWRVTNEATVSQVGDVIPHSEGVLTCTSKVPVQPLSKEERSALADKLIKDIKDASFDMSRDDLVRRINDLR